MYLHCLPCDDRFRNCRDWYKHLNSEKHQDVAKQSLNNCSTEMGFRSIVCSKFNNAFMDSHSLDEYSLVTYFGSFGLVHDIYYKRSGEDGDITACLVLLDSVEVVAAIMAEWGYGYRSDTPQFRSSIGSLTRRCDLKESEFNKLMEDASEEAFQRRHDKLVEICGNMSLQQQLDKFSEMTSLSDRDIEKREGFLKELKSIVRQVFPRAKCIPFGSYLIGVSDRNSDLDVFIDVGIPLKSSDPDVLIEGEGSLSLDEVFDRVLRQLRRSNSIQNPVSRRRLRRFKSIIPIMARVPIIRLIHEETSLHCDLSFKSLGSVINSNLMRFYTLYDPRVHPLMTFIRYWGRMHSLLGSNKIKPYALMLMIVVYLNQELILPNLIYLQQLEMTKNNTNLMMVNGWNFAFMNDVDIVRKAAFDFVKRSSDYFQREVSYKDILQLATGFFKKFGAFDFESFVICPLMGSQVDKVVFTDPDTFASMEFPASFSKLQKLRHSTSMCVQDPFILDFNVTSNVTIKIVKTFTSLCRETSTILDKILLQANEQENGINLFSEVFLNTKGLIVKKISPALPLKTQDPIIGNIVDTLTLKGVDKVEIEKPVSVSVSKIENIVQQPNNKENEAITPAQQADASGNSEFAMDVSLSEYNNFEDAADALSHDVVETDVADKNIAPPDHELFNHPFIPEIFTYSLGLSVSLEFEQLFKTVLSSLDSRVEVENRMKITWVAFADDFFRNIFDKGFGLKIITQNKLPYRRPLNLNLEEMRDRRELDDCLPYTIDVSLDGNKKRYKIQTILPNSSFCKKRDHSPGDPQMHQELVKRNPFNINRRGNVIVESMQSQDFSMDVTDGHNFAPSRNSDLATRSTSDAEAITQTAGPISNSINANNGIEPTPQDSLFIYPLTRDAYTKLQSGFRKPFSMALEIGGEADAFIERKHRSFKRSLFTQKSDVLYVNPINMEERATMTFQRLALVSLKRENNQGVNGARAGRRRMGVNFRCNISVDTLEPFVVVHLNEVLDSPAKFPVVHIIRDTGFSQMFHQYAMYRLKKMLSKPRTN